MPTIFWQRLLLLLLGVLSFWAVAAREAGGGVALGVAVPQSEQVERGEMGGAWHVRSTQAHAQ